MLDPACSSDDGGSQEYTIALKGFPDFRVIVRQLVWDNVNGLTSRENSEPSPVSSHTRSKINHFFQGKDEMPNKPALEASAAGINPQSFMGAHGTTSDDEDDCFKCVVCGKVFMSRKRLLKHAKLIHPRISDSMIGEESSTGLKGRLNNP